MSVFEKWLSILQNHACVGLTFSDYSIRMVLLRGNADNLSHLQHWEEWLEPGIVENGRVKDEQAFSNRLKDMVRALKARGKKTYFAIPDAQLVLRRFDLQGRLSDSDLQNYFFIEIGNKIQLPFEQAVFAFHVIDRSATGTRVLLFAAPESIVRQYRKVLAASGLNPVSAEFSALGIDRWAQYSQPQIAQKQRMYVQLEKDALYVSIIHEDIPLFVRQVSLKDPENRSDDILSLNAATEIERMLNFYQYSLQDGTDKVSEIYLLGDGGRMAAFRTALSEAVSLHVQLLAIDHETTQCPDDVGADLIPAIGLAMKEAVK